MKFLVLLLFLVFSLAIAPPAAAAYCRNVGEHQICVLDVKRSAKYYWEYRATVSVDEVERSQEIYNCRDRLRVRQDGRIVPFEGQGPGPLICSLLYRA